MKALLLVKVIFIDDKLLLVKFKIKTIIYILLFDTVVVFLENSTSIKCYKIELVFIYKKDAHNREGLFAVRISRRIFESHTNTQNSFFCKTVPYVALTFRPNF